jgi:hypothetical protein
LAVRVHPVDHPSFFNDVNLILTRDDSQGGVCCRC